MNLLKTKQRGLWSSKSVLRALSIAVVLGGAHAGAQPLYPQNPLGAFLNGLGANIARQQTLAAAQQAWNGVDPQMYQCLMRTLSPSPPVLANSGISPGDPRLQPYFQRCADSIAQANAQRESAARQAADEQQREQATFEAQRAEQAREQTEELAQKLAAEKAQRVEEQRLVVQRRTQEAAFATVRALPELSSYISRAEPALIFLYVPASKNLMRGLDGKVSAVGQARPLICWTFPTTGASSTDFFLWAMKRLEAQTQTRQFDLMPCPGDNPDDEQSDVLLFSTSDLVDANAQKALQLAQSIRAGHLIVLLDARQEEYDATVAVDRKRQEDAAAEAKARAAKVESTIDTSTEPGVAVLIMQLGGEGPVCVVGPVDFDAVKQVVAKSDNQPLLGQMAGMDEVNHLSENDTFIHIKSGQCGLLVGDTASLREIRTALKRDGFSPGSGVVWITDADFKSAEELVAQQRAAQEIAKALARDEAVRKAAEQQAQEREVAAAAAAEKAKAIAKKRDATDAASQLIDHP